MLLFGNEKSELQGGMKWEWSSLIQILESENTKRCVMQLLATTPVKVLDVKEGNLDIEEVR